MGLNYIWCNSTRVTPFLSLRFPKDLIVKKKRIMLEIQTTLQTILQTTDVVSDYWQMKKMILMMGHSLIPPFFKGDIVPT